MDYAAGPQWSFTLRVPQVQRDHLQDLLDESGAVASAERALQPGTGTTDLVLGASARKVLGLADALNLQFAWTHAWQERDGYKPGQHAEFSAGWTHALNQDWSVVLQANLAHREHDSGANAEPTLSGGTTLSLTPGVSLALGHDDTVYGLVQLPVYQKVAGIQLVPRASLALGWTHAF